jgi:hypothetical protein
MRRRNLQMRWMVWVVKGDDVQWRGQTQVRWVKAMDGHDVRRHGLARMRQVVRIWQSTARATIGSDWWVDGRVVKGLMLLKVDLAVRQVAWVVI